MSSILYYGILWPLSKLPLAVLYLLADFVYLLFVSVWPYRKKVIETNLKRSFPEKSQQELRLIQRKFYRHLADLLAESIKNFSISSDELLKRIEVEHPEVMHKLAEKHKNVLLLGGHYGNWEWVITSQALLFEQHAIGLGKPLSNGFFDKKINALRGRYGMDIVNAKNYKAFIAKEYDKGFAMLTLTDQSPGDSRKSYWMQFLNQPTAVLYGAEQMAHQYDLALVFFRLKKIKRGHYLMHLELIAESPKGLTYGTITERHTRLLEQQILEQPEFWLWSHKRWKREIPHDLETLMEQHRREFDLRYKDQV